MEVGRKHKWQRGREREKGKEMAIIFSGALALSSVYSISLDLYVMIITIILAFYVIFVVYANRIFDAQIINKQMKDQIQ